MRIPMAEKSTAIILFAHGSAVPEANRQVALLAEEVSRLAGSPAACAFLEMAQPDLPTALAQAAGAGAQRIVVVPYFLTMGVHVCRDLPELVERQRTLLPEVEIVVGQSLEGYSGMAELIVNRLKEILPEDNPL